MKSLKSWKNLIIFVGITGAGLLPLSGSAGGTAGNSIYGSRYTSGRAAGMGGAFLPLADDGASALFYNPAALAKLKGFRLEPMNLETEMGSGFLGSIGKNTTKVTSLNSYKSELTQHPNDRIGASAGYLPNFYFKGFAAGVLVSDRFSARYNNIPNTIDTGSQFYLIPAAGFGIPLARGIVRIGYVAQYVQKSEGTNTVPASTGNLAYNQNVKEGSALSHNLGYALNLPYHDLPSWNVVARNIGSAHYTSSKMYAEAKSPTGPPDREPMTIDTSLSMQPKIGNGTYMNLVLEGKDLTNRSHISPLARISFGMEFVAREALFLRGGWGNGYPSIGLGLKTKKGELSFSWFSEEIGGSYHAERDQRYMFHYQIRVF